MKVAFHSYKGGVGRTKLMVGVGALLAMQGRRVGLLDFDLDSSALATIFQADTENLAPFELLSILKNPNENMRKVLDSLKDETAFLAEKLGEEPKQPGRLRYLPTVTDPAQSDGLELGLLDIELLLDTVEQDGGVDLVLIDVKPGYSPSYKVISDFVERFVCVTRIDTQNIEGLARLVPEVKKVSDPILVANMVPESEKSAPRLRRLEEACGKKVDVQISYDPELIFDDDLGFLGGPESRWRTQLSKIGSLLMEK